MYLCSRSWPSSNSPWVPSVKHGRIFPSTWPPPPLPPFSSYNTSPHRKIINRWVGWEQLPARAARHLGKQASLLRFPGKEEEGKPQLDCHSHSLEPEKPDKNHRYLSLSCQDLLALHTYVHKSGHTNQETDKHIYFFHRNLWGGITVNTVCSFITNNLQWAHTVPQYYDWLFSFLIIEISRFC